MEIQEDSFKFLSTRYYGSKKRHLSWIHEQIKNIKPCKALDAFGGTGAVTALLASNGFDVKYNDIYKFNEISAKAIFNIKNNLTEKKFKQIILNINPQEGVVSKNFNNLYFTQDENLWIDGLMYKIKNINEDDRNIIMYCLFQSCLKKRPYNLFHRDNLYFRFNKKSLKFGNHTTWNKSFLEHMVSTYNELKLFQEKFHGQVKVYKSQDATKIKDYNFKLVYLDPPYLKHKTNNEKYLDKYHFLEGLSDYQNWEKKINKDDNLRRFIKNDKNEWQSKDDHINGIGKLIDKHNNADFILSYIDNQIPSQKELINIFKGKFRKIYINKLETKVALSKNKITELLIKGER